MGCGISFICKDCRKVFYLGYGSSSTWYMLPNTVEEYDDKATKNPENATLLKNQNMRKCLTEHGMHEFEYLYHDDEDLEDLVESPNEYEMIDLYNAGDLAFC